MDTERKEHFNGPKDATFGEIERFYRENFNTMLSPDEEWRFHCVCDETDVDLGEALVDYDLRGAFKDGSLYEDNRPDKYRKPNHPLFSVISIYHKTPDLQHGGEYEGGEFGQDECCCQTFKPSEKMLKTTHPAGWLKAWIREHAPKIKVILPEAEKHAQ